MRLRFIIVAVVLLGAWSVAYAQSTTQPIAWQPWSDDVFDRAKKENKFVLMDLQAVWCHWCHVMDQTTYLDPQVIALINQKYIAVKVDQDSRPDISNRYEDYGWPATVVFNATGGEIVKRRGYLEPQQMRSMLQAIIDDPTPGPSITEAVQVHPADSASLSEVSREILKANLKSLYDDKNAGWYGITKFVDADVLEYCMLQSLHGDKTLEQMARQTLTANLQIIDPVWGGVYQYSAEGDWAHPHFEKIMSYQSDDMRTYARAYQIWHDPAYLKAAQDIDHFLETFLLSPEGAFYTSQDADQIPGQHGSEYFSLDDATRRKRGIPKIDQHIYSRENGWAITALVSLHNATGDANPLAAAERAADWIIKNRSLPGGGFSHDQHDIAGPYLGDALAMGRAFLSLYAATADRIWLQRADEAAHFIENTFSSNLGVITAVSHGPLASNPEVDENATTARFARLLFAYTANQDHQKLAELAMRYVAAPQIAGARHWAVGGILLADLQMNAEPLHITVVGKKDDPTAQQLFAVAQSTPMSYFRLEWYDAREGSLPHMDVQFPSFPYAAAFVCTGSSCSSPSKNVENLTQKLAKAIK